MPVEFCLLVEPHEGASYDVVRDLAIEGAALGFSGLFSTDHLLSESGQRANPSEVDAWATMAALAVQTEGIRIGTLVTPVTFRAPGPFLVTVAQVNAMSGGRLDVGLGTGWYEAEHQAYGLAFPTADERFARLSEQLALFRAFWSGDEAPLAFDGAFGSVRCPRPRVAGKGYGRPGLIVGGRGTRKTPRLAARWADEHNVPFATTEVVRRCFDRSIALCDAYGRDPSTLRRSVAVTVCCGASAADLRRRRAALRPYLAATRDAHYSGAPDEVVAAIGECVEMGSERVYLQILDPTDLDHVRLLADALLPEFR